MITIAKYFLKTSIPDSPTIPPPAKARKKATSHNENSSKTGSRTLNGVTLLCSDFFPSQKNALSKLLSTILDQIALEYQKSARRFPVQADKCQNRSSTLRAIVSLTRFWATCFTGHSTQESRSCFRFSRTTKKVGHCNARFESADTFLTRSFAR